jgi:thymidylate synthase (FAD)
MILSDKPFVPVLNCGHVEYVDHMGSDLTVVNAARVSFNKETDWAVDEAAKQRLVASGSTYHESDLRVLSDKDKKLIGYLAKHDHWTPFAHPQITVRIKAPIFVRTQLFKHKIGFTENEISRRYCTDEPQFYTPEWRAAPTDGAKQGSSDFITEPIIHDLDKMFNKSAMEAVEIYNLLLREGVAPEQARAVLPQGVYTEWWWTGSLSAFGRVCRLRSDAHAQWEVQQYAKALSEIIQPLFPVAWAALTDHPT